MLWLLIYRLWAPLSAALYVAFLFGSGIIFNKSAPGEHDQMMSIFSLLSEIQKGSENQSHARPSYPILTQFLAACKAPGRKF